MPPTISVREAYRVPFRSLAPFLLISFGLAWGILGLYIFIPEPMGAVFGQLTGNHPLFFLAVYAPAIAAFTLVARNGGLSGLRRFFSRALLWRCGAAWYAFLIIGIPLIFIGGSAIRGNLFTEPFPFASFQALLVGVGPGRHQRPGRGVRLAGSRTSSSAKEVRSDLGRADSWRHMGAVASASLSVERNPAERVDIHGILCWVPGDKRHRNGSLQPVAWQHSAVGVLPLLAHEPDLSGRTALRHVPADRRCSPGRLVEPQGYVHKGRFCHRSHPARKCRRWLPCHALGRESRCAPFPPVMAAL